MIMPATQVRTTCPQWTTCEEVKMLEARKEQVLGKLTRAKCGVMNVKNTDTSERIAQKRMLMMQTKKLMEKQS